jgi:basic membrane protein A
MMDLRRAMILLLTLPICTHAIAGMMPKLSEDHLVKNIMTQLSFTAHYSLYSSSHTYMLTLKGISSSGTGSGSVGNFQCTVLSATQLTCSNVVASNTGAFEASLWQNSDILGVYVLVTYGQPQVVSLEPKVLNVLGGDLVKLTLQAVSSLASFPTVTMRVTSTSGQSFDFTLQMSGTIGGGTMKYAGRIPQISFPAADASISIALNGQTFFSIAEKVSFQQVAKVKVGFLYVTDPTDFGWTFQHNFARLELEKKFLGRIETVYVDHVTEWGPNQCDFCATHPSWNATRNHWNEEPSHFFGTHQASMEIKKLVEEEGCKVIFATSWWYHWDTYHMAEVYKDVTFGHVGAWLTGPNMAQVFPKVYQARYLSGIVVAWYIKKLGLKKFVGFQSAFKLGETVRAINAFKLGLEAVDPEIKVGVVWGNDWFNPRKERIGTSRLIQFYGAEAIAQHTDSREPQIVANENKKVGVGYNTDMLLTVGDSVLTSPVLVWGGEYAKVLQSVLDGNAELDPSIRNLWNGLGDETWRLSDLSPRVPPEAKAQVDLEIQKFANGEDTVYCKPGLKDNKGRARNDPSKPNPAINPVPWEATHLQSGTTCLTSDVVNQVCQEYDATGSLCVDHWLLDGVFDFCEPTSSNPEGFPLIDGNCYLGTLDIPDECPAGHELTIEGCKACPAGSFGKDEKCTLCPKGYFAPTAGMEECTPCQTGFAASEPGAVQCTKCSVGTMTDGFAADQCVKCAAGTFGVEDTGFSSGKATNTTLGCMKCPLNTYSNDTGAIECTPCGEFKVTPFMGASAQSDCTCGAGTYFPMHKDPHTTDCKKCPGGMSCAGGIVPPWIAPGYWAEPSAPYDAMKCRSVSLCPGGEVDDDVCGDGRTGRNCAVCKENMYRASTTGPCQECTGADAVPMILAILVFLAMPLLLHHVCNSNDVSARQSQAMVLAAVMGQVITYSQIFSMVGTFNISWPAEIQGIFDVYSFFMLRLQLLRPSCLFGSWAFESDYLSGLLMPFLFAGVYIAEYAIILLFAKFRSAKPPKWDWDTVCNTLGRTFQVFHVAILKQVTTVLECYEHPNGDRSLVMFPQVICGDEEHMSIMPVTAIILFLYCGVFFAYLCWVVYVAPERFSKKSFARRHRYLLLKFRPDKWYWAVPLFMRNTILAFIIAMAPDYPIVQICLFNIILMIFLALTLTHAPWKDPKNNMLDAALTMILMVFSLAALPLAPMDDRLIWPLTMIMILAVSLEVLLVGCVVGLLVHKVLQQILRSAKKRKSKADSSVLPLSEIREEKQEKANENQSEAWKKKAGQYTEGDSAADDIQDMQRKLAASFHDVCKHLTSTSPNKIAEFLSNLTIYDARLVHKFVRLVQAECMGMYTGTSKSDQRLLYNTMQKAQKESTEKVVSSRSGSKEEEA